MSRKHEILKTLSNSLRKARQRAAQQPDVLRHEMYAKSLRMLYQELEELPENHQLFERFDREAPHSSGASMSGQSNR